MVVVIVLYVVAYCYMCSCSWWIGLRGAGSLVSGLCDGVVYVCG